MRCSKRRATLKQSRKNNSSALKFCKHTSIFCSFGAGVQFVVFTSFANRKTGANLLTWAFIKALKPFGKVYLVSADVPNYEDLQRFYGPLFEKPDKHITEIGLLDALSLIANRGKLVLINTHADTVPYPLTVNYYHDLPFGQTTPLGGVSGLASLLEGLEDLVKAHAKLNLSNSRRTAKLLDRHGISAVVLYPPVPIPSKVYKGDNSAVGYFGRIAENKRIEVLLDVAEKLPDVRVIIAGKPSKMYAEKLKKEAERRGLKNVEIIAKELTEDEKARVLSKIGVLVHTRKGEPFGIAPLEGVYHGAVPLLPCDSGAYEILEGTVPCWRSAEEIPELAEEILKERKLYALQARVRVEGKTSFERFKTDLARLLERFGLL